MIEACEANGTVISVDHTNRWKPHYDVAREAIRNNSIGEVKRIVGHLGGPRAMLFRNGTHLVDGVCFFADSDPEWVFAELEPGYDHYDRYLGDGGRDPATDPAGSGYIHFRNGVRAFINATKGQYPASFGIQVYGETGMIEVHNSRVIRRDRNTTEFYPFPFHELTGIPACVAELTKVMENGGDLLSPAREAKKTVEVLVGFLQSHARGNVRVDLPLPPGH